MKVYGAADIRGRKVNLRFSFAHKPSVFEVFYVANTAFNNYYAVEGLPNTFHIRCGALFDPSTQRWVTLSRDSKLSSNSQIYFFQVDLTESMSHIEDPVSARPYLNGFHQSHITRGRLMDAEDVNTNHQPQQQPVVDPAVSLPPPPSTPRRSESLPQDVSEILKHRPNSAAASHSGSSRSITPPARPEHATWHNILQEQRESSTRPCEEGRYISHARGYADSTTSTSVIASVPPKSHSMPRASSSSCRPPSRGRAAASSDTSIISFVGLGKNSRCESVLKEEHQRFVHRLELPLDDFRRSLREESVGSVSIL